MLMPFSRRVSKNDIVVAVTRAIVMRWLFPGCKLGEQVLADLFGINRAGVRQAMIRLADDGLVTIELNRGAFVSRPNYRDAVEIFDALTIIEQGVATQLIDRMNPNVLHVLRRHVELQHKVVDEKNNVMSDQLGSSFHEVFVKLIRNSLVEEIHAQIVRRTALLRAFVTQLSKRSMLKLSDERPYSVPSLTAVLIIVDYFKTTQN